MTHAYNITGMTCTGCEAKVKNSLLLLLGVTFVEVSRDNNTATITMEKHISLNALQQAISKTGDKYQITSLQHSEGANKKLVGDIQATSPNFCVHYFSIILFGTNG